MSFSVLTATIPIYANNQDSGEIQTPITITTDKSSYENSERVTIFGNISNYDSLSQSPLTFVVISPENNLVALRQLIPKSDGSFEFSFTSGGPQWKYNGDYIVELHFGAILSETTFVYTGGYVDFTSVICASNEELVNGVCVLKEPEPTQELELQPDSKSITIPAPFVDESKDPQHYIDRYNNESSYKKWFDDNYPEYNSIYQAVGLGNSKFTESFDTLESNIPEGSSQIIPGTDSSIWNTRDDGFTINYPTGWLFDQGKRTVSGEYRYVISFFNPEDTAQITITKIFYPEMLVTMDLFYDMFDNPEKYNLVLDKDMEENFFSVFILMEISELLQCEYNYEDDYGCTDFTVNALSLFENDGGLPALQIEYSYAEKLFGDNITYGYSALVTKYYLQDRPIVIYSDSSLNDYGQLRSYFVDAANSFSIKDGAENKLSDKIKFRLLSDMKSFPNSDIAEIINDALEQTKGYSIPIIEYGQIVLETTKAKNSKGDTFTSISALNQYDIPSWLKGVEDFWAEGKITDSEFDKCLSFLIDNDIIKVLEIPEPSPEPELIPEPEPIPEPEQLPPNISIANPRVVNAYGKELDSVNVSQRVQIGIDITNHNSFKQLFTFHMIIRESGYEESISGQLSDSQSLSPALSWIPTDAGTYIVDLSVFDNLQNKNKLADSIVLVITVN